MGVGVGVAVGEGVGVRVGVDVGVLVGVDVRVAVGIAVAVAVDVGVLVRVAVGVALAVAWTKDRVGVSTSSDDGPGAVQAARTVPRHKAIDKSHSVASLLALTI